MSGSSLSSGPSVPPMGAGGHTPLPPAAGGGGGPPPCPDYFRWLITLKSAVVGASGGRLDPASRAAVLAEIPAHERDLVAMGPPDAPLYELARQAGRIWANTNDPVKREYWAGVILALYSACLDAMRLAASPAARRQREAELAGETRRDVMGG